jgi:hypothetical protein
MAEQANAPHTLRIKIGDAEFEASGTEETVREQYRLFLDVLAANPPRETVNRSAPPKQENGVTEVPEATVQRAFAVDGDRLSLRVLPSGDNRDADALLMLLWGFEKLRGETTVSATTLMRAGRESGLQIVRIDRVIVVHSQYYQVGGRLKGTRYGLNNPGRSYAAKLVADLFK